MLFRILDTKKMSCIGLCAGILFLTACTTTTHYAGKQVREIPVPLYYTVKSGDTLSKIGQKYHLDYMSIAELNHIPAPYNHIEVGQKLRLKGAKDIKASISKNSKKILKAKTIKTKTIQVNPAVKTVPNPNTVYQQPTSPMVNNPPLTTVPLNNPSNTGNVSHWLKPTLHQYTASYNLSNQVLYYYGQEGDPIYAVADGVVTYSSPPVNNNLAPYGNVVIIQHNDGYVSAYSHNQYLKVVDGQSVKAGQQIATMGRTGVNVQYPMLEFQLKRNGQPLDPRQLIP